MFHDVQDHLTSDGGDVNSSSGNSLVRWSNKGHLFPYGLLWKHSTFDPLVFSIKILWKSPMYSTLKPVFRIMKGISVCLNIIGPRENQREIDRKKNVQSFGILFSRNCASDFACSWYFRRCSCSKFVQTTPGESWPTTLRRSFKGSWPCGWLVQFAPGHQIQTGVFLLQCTICLEMTLVSSVSYLIEVTELSWIQFMIAHEFSWDSESTWHMIPDWRWSSYWLRAELTHVQNSWRDSFLLH